MSELSEQERWIDSFNDTKGIKIKKEKKKLEQI